MRCVGRCFAIVFEAVSAAVTEAIVERLEVPVIGIAAGPAADGQVLVFHEMVDGMKHYVDEIRTAHFSEPDHVYGIDPAGLADFHHYLEQESLSSAKAWGLEPLS